MIPVEPIHEFIEGIGYDALIESILMLISALVCVTAYKVYQITKGRNSQMLSLGFLMLSISYATVAAGNLTLFLQQTVFVQESFFFIIHFSYLFAKTLGLLTLATIPLKITDKRIYALLAFLAFVGVYASVANIVLFQAIILVFYAIIVVAHAKAYLAKRNKNTLMLALGFGLLAFASVAYMFLDRGFEVYILGHILEFAGYAFILAALLFAYTFQHETRKTSNHS